MRRTPATLTGLALALLLGACSTPDDSPVPTTAAAPWACPGVPQEGVDLILGGAAEDTETRNSWEPGLGHATFGCLADRGDDARLTVTYGGPGSGPTADSMKTMRGAVPITADATGEGWADQSDELNVAVWECGDNVLMVRFEGTVEGRDSLTDATHLLVSMLPWACDGAEVPGLPG
ncbi:hypothetical protein OMK64_02265 [Cellulomonas fimi]|uniref:hypothetical protein n=1 Tax=Cellulomonas fimi TaxID=1708 RepID=UPI00234D4806|nr:hypothetical protein [Cellulomonas fimi]MDC7120355.1 hypothetical protein [Cellulomonas fimi]